MKEICEMSVNIRRGNEVLPKEVEESLNKYGIYVPYEELDRLIEDSEYRDSFLRKVKFMNDNPTKKDILGIIVDMYKGKYIKILDLKNLLNVSNTNQIKHKISEENLFAFDVEHGGQTRNMLFTNEEGLMQAVINSQNTVHGFNLRSLVIDKLTGKETEVKNLNEKYESVDYDSLYLFYNKESNLLKIGRSGRTKSRHKEVCKSEGTELEILFDIPGIGYTELSVHEKFKDLRVKGEWFKYDESIINFYKEKSKPCK